MRQIPASRLVVLFPLLLGAAFSADILAARVVPPRLVAADPDSLAAPRIALGDSIYRGKIGGANCFTCHGVNARGVPGLGPDLTDSTWVNSDGSYAGILRTITDGVEKPVISLVPMAPSGGALNEEQRRALASFVLALSRRKVAQ